MIYNKNVTNVVRLKAEGCVYTLYIVYGCSDVYVYITSSAYAE